MARCEKRAEMRQHVARTVSRKQSRVVCAVLRNVLGKKRTLLSRVSTYIPSLANVVTSYVGCCQTHLLVGAADDIGLAHVYGSFAVRSAVEIGFHTVLLSKPDDSLLVGAPARRTVGCFSLNGICMTLYVKPSYTIVSLFWSPGAFFVHARSAPRPAN